MRIHLPRSDNHSQIKVLVNHPMTTSATTLDDSHYHLDIDLPEGGDVDDLEVLAQFCGRNGEPDIAYKTMILKERVERNDPKPEPEPEPEPEAKQEPDRVPERDDQPASGELPGDTSTTGDDQPAVSEPDGVDEPESNDASCEVSQAAEFESGPPAGSIPAVPVSGKSRKK